jgi:hypothetical protein
MKLNTIAQTFTIAAVTTLAPGIAPAANADDKGCTNVTMRGTYAYTTTGFIVTPVAIAGPTTEVGTQVFDGNGNTTATATISTKRQPDTVEHYIHSGSRLHRHTHAPGFRFRHHRSRSLRDR